MDPGGRAISQGQLIASCLASASATTKEERMDGMVIKAEAISSEGKQEVFRYKKICLSEKELRETGTTPASQGLLMVPKVGYGVKTLAYLDLDTSPRLVVHDLMESLCVRLNHRILVLLHSYEKEQGKEDVEDDNHQSVDRHTIVMKVLEELAHDSSFSYISLLHGITSENKEDEDELVEEEEEEEEEEADAFVTPEVEVAADVRVITYYEVLKRYEENHSLFMCTPIGEIGKAWVKNLLRLAELGLLLGSMQSTDDVVVSPVHLRQDLLAFATTSKTAAQMRIVAAHFSSALLSNNFDWEVKYYHDGIEEERDSFDGEGNKVPLKGRILTRDPPLNEIKGSAAASMSMSAIEDRLIIYDDIMETASKWLQDYPGVLHGQELINIAATWFKTKLTEKRTRKHVAQRKKEVAAAKKRKKAEW